MFDCNDVKLTLMKVTGIVEEERKAAERTGEEKPRRNIK
jgi:hypothetical protein